MKWNKLRLDLALMGEDEINSYVQNILKYTGYSDILAIANKLNKAIEEHWIAVRLETQNKFCDKCERSYPSNYEKCDKCGSDLRAYRNTDNLEEIFKNAKRCRNCGEII